MAVQRRGRANTTEIDRLVADLNSAGPKAQAEVYGAVKRAAVRVRDEWRANWSGLRRARHLARAVGWDISRVGLTEVEFEVGPDKDKTQGPLGNIIEFGTSRSAPIPGGGPALQKVEPELDQWLDDIVAGLL